MLTIASKCVRFPVYGGRSRCKKTKTPLPVVLVWRPGQEEGWIRYEAQVQDITPPTVCPVRCSCRRCEPSVGRDLVSRSEMGLQSAQDANGGVIGGALRKPATQLHGPSVIKYVDNSARLKRNLVIEGLFKTQKKITLNRRIRECCEYPAHVLNAQVVERANGSVTIEGLNTCQNTICVNCARIRARDHAQKLGRILRNAQEQGHRIVFGTFGVNNRDSRLDLRGHYKACLGTWQKTFRTRFCDEIGIKAWVRSLDFTVKPNGDVNLHWHCILILEKGIQAPTDELYSRIYQRWSDQAFTYEKRTSYSGNDLREIAGTEGVSRYMAKRFNPLELVSREKTSLRSWTITDLLAVIQEDQNPRHIAIYRNLEKGLKRTRQIAYSKVCADFDVELDEKTEEEEASEVVATTEIPRDIWMSFKSLRMSIIAAFIVDGMAKEYFKTLCDLVWENGVIFSTEELEDHKRIFKLACQRDFSSVQGRKSLWIDSGYSPA